MATDGVDFLFHCVKDGKLSKEQAEAIINKSSSSHSSSSPGHCLAPLVQKAATFSAPGSSTGNYSVDSCVVHKRRALVAK